MKKEHYGAIILSVFLIFYLCDLIYGAILPSWTDKKAYHPVPPVFVHGNITNTAELQGIRLNTGISDEEFK